MKPKFLPLRPRSRKQALLVLVRVLCITAILMSCSGLMANSEASSKGNFANSESHYSTSTIFFEINVRTHQPNQPDNVKQKRITVSAAYQTNLAAPSLDSGKQRYINNISAFNGVLKVKKKPAYLLLDTPPPSFHI